MLFQTKWQYRFSDYAAMYGSDPDIVSLVEAGVPVDLRCKVQKNGDGYFTPLQIVETAEAAATLVGTFFRVCIIIDKVLNYIINSPWSGFGGSRWSWMVCITRGL
jgi:hypothetical protein